MTHAARPTRISCAIYLYLYAHIGYICIPTSLVPSKSPACLRRHRRTGIHSAFQSCCQCPFRPGCSPVSFHGILLQVSVFSRDLEPPVCVMVFALILDELLDNFFSCPIPFESRQKRVLIPCLTENDISFIIMRGLRYLQLRTVWPCLALGPAPKELPN
jgi:hypothetical protein